MHHDAEYQAQLSDGRFVIGLGDPQIVDRAPDDALVSSQASPADANPTDGMSDIARQSFLLGLAFSRLMADYAARHPLHESQDAGIPTPAPAQLQGESRGETR